MGDSRVKGNQKYVLVPPDGGWGYMICVAATIMFISTSSFIGCEAIIFHDFMKQIGMESAGFGLLGGINAISFAISALLVNPLNKILSLRKMAVLAAVLLNIGTFSMVFVNSQVPFFLAQGFFQGLGYGSLYAIACNTLNDYFVEKRLLVVSLTQTVAAIAGMTMPLIVKWSLNELGFRGTLILINGITLHTLLAAALLQPVSMHMKKLPIFDDNLEDAILILEEENKIDKISSLKTTDVAIVEKEGNLYPRQKETSSFRKFVDEIIDLTMLKSYFKSNASIGLTFCVFAEFYFCLILPQALYSMHLDENTVALAVSLGCFGDLATRFAFILLNKCLSKIASHTIYITGLVFTVITKLGMLWSTDVTAILIFIFLSGIPRCIICMLPPIILSDAVSADKFLSAMGIFCFLAGNMILILGPTLGAIRDITNSYTTVFYILISCSASVIMSWCIEIFCKKNKHKRMQRKISCRQ